MFLLSNVFPKFNSWGLCQPPREDHNFPIQKPSLPFFTCSRRRQMNAITNIPCSLYSRLTLHVILVNLELHAFYLREGSMFVGARIEWEVLQSNRGYPCEPHAEAVRERIRVTVRTGYACSMGGLLCM